MIKRLTIEQAAKAFEMRNSGLKWWQIAQSLSVAEPTLHRILRKAKSNGFEAWNKK